MVWPWRPYNASKENSPGDGEPSLVTGSTRSPEFSALGRMAKPTSVSWKSSDVGIQDWDQAGRNLVQQGCWAAVTTHPWTVQDSSSRVIPWAVSEITRWVDCSKLGSPPPLQNGSKIDFFGLLKPPGGLGNERQWNYRTWMITWKNKETQWLQ